MIWDQLTSPQIAQLDKNIPVVLVMAATEQHGPHLPLATDRLIGSHFAHMLEKAMPQQVLILPPVS
ncbi:MAG: creatininase family protein, partial [Mucilaginibacter sp.]